MSLASLDCGTTAARGGVEDRSATPDGGLDGGCRNGVSRPSMEAQRRGEKMESSQQQNQESGQAQQVADQAREKVGEAAEQAKETAQNVAGQAQERIRQQVDQRSTDAGEQVGGTAADIRSVGEELRNQGKEGPAKIADQAADRIERAGSYLRDSDSDRLLNDLEDFGRRRPWAVFAGAAVAGIAA